MNNLFLPNPLLSPPQGSLPSAAGRRGRTPANSLSTRWLALLAGCLLGLGLGTTAHAQDFVWAKSIGGSGGEQGNSIAVDASGNVYTAGSFFGTVDFDPGPATFNLTTVNDAIFISKLDASGNFIWAKSMGGYGPSIAVDASGNVYTTGYFSGTVDFDPGPAAFDLSSLGGVDIFVSKLDASGNFVWARSLGGSSYEGGFSIAVDASGNVYTTGYFQGTVDFDPGPAAFDLTESGSNDIFVSKLDASGNFVWARSMGGSSYEVGSSIVVDASGHVYTTGYFNGTADFDPGAATADLTPAGSFDIFVSKLDASGNFVWARSMGGSSYEVGSSIAVDAFGNVYTTGSFQGTVDFDPGPASFDLTPSGSNDIFVSKLDASGNFVWAKRMGGSSPTIGRSIALDASGHVYTTGYFLGTADFDPGAATADLTSAGSIDIFVSKLDAFGNFVWAKRMGGSNTDGGQSIAVGALGNVYTTGIFDGTADFDPGAATFNLTSAGGFDIFVSKLGPACTPPTAYGVTGGGAYCAGGTGMAVGMAGSQSGVSYQLKRDGSDVGSLVAGTGSALGFGSFTTVGTYTVLATSDAGGCTMVMTGSVAVAVNPLPTMNVSSNATLYLGYGPACTTLTASASGGTGSITLAWSNGDTGGSTQVCPTSTTTYTVTATDAAGCSTSKDITVTVIDVRCGNKSDKVTVCHNGKELCISPSAVSAHLAHGDQLGSCGGQNPAARLGAEEVSAQPLELSLKAYPNPVQDAVTVQVLSRVAGTASFEVLDVTGRARQSRRQELAEGINEVEFRLGSLPTGIYLIRGVDPLGQQGIVRVSKE